MEDCDKVNIIKFLKELTYDVENNLLHEKQVISLKEFYGIYQVLNTKLKYNIDDNIDEEEFRNFIKFVLLFSFMYKLSKKIDY